MVDDAVREGTPSPPGVDAAFESEARAAGIVLPRKAPRDPWAALVIVIAIVVLTAGIGEVTGWIDLRSSAATGGYQTQTCQGYPVHSEGTFSSAIDPAFASWLEDAGTNLSAAVGGCFSVAVSPEPGDGYLSLSATSGSEFTATYAAPTTEESGSLGSPVAVFPLTLSAVDVVYDLPGVSSGLNLTGTALAGIYDGSITSWNDPAIASANPGVDLSGLPAITPVHLAGSLVANEVLTDYLAASSPSWNASVGAGLNVSWPTGTSAASEAVALAAVAATPGAVGYVETFGAPVAGLGVANLNDSAGTFAAPSTVDVWLAAESLANSTAVTNGSWSGFSLVGASLPGSYPLSSLAYAGIYRDLGVAYSNSLSLGNATWLLTYLYWLTGEAAVAPLPAPYAAEDVNVLNNETYDGVPIVSLDSEYGESGESGGETGEF